MTLRGRDRAGDEIEMCQSLSLIHTGIKNNERIYNYARKDRQTVVTVDYSRYIPIPSFQNLGVFHAVCVDNNLLLHMYVFISSIPTPLKIEMHIRNNCYFLPSVITRSHCDAAMR